LLAKTRPPDTALRKLTECSRSKLVERLPDVHGIVSVDEPKILAGVKRATFVDPEKAVSRGSTEYVTVETAHSLNKGDVAPLGRFGTGEQHGTNEPGLPLDLLEGRHHRIIEDVDVAGIGVVKIGES
jgi:hypothetical protein